MADASSAPVVYWDASAILSILFTDKHSQIAKRWADREGFHLISTLAYAETCAVIARMKRENLLSDLLIQAAWDVLQDGPWRHLNALPERGMMHDLSSKWPLRGADLWHLATAKGLQGQLPELSLLTFDHRLLKAAEGEGLSIG
ncbi:MAG: type II toxin-antitoxin system VapC family toxin [Deltaproteobacteria bacterium]|nr:type II toxin-antitoxin system VapC family toxin [Deltaproteobacteria bacterium]